jgi:hypothetical protein
LPLFRRERSVVFDKKIQLCSAGHRQNQTHFLRNRLTLQSVIRSHRSQSPPGPYASAWSDPSRTR